MSINVDIVMGANYGDEGKGRITSYIANNYDVDDTCVVLHTGSAQRGHTSWDRDMKYRHVFHHFGSATLDGYPTYLASSYIVNPIIFRKEWEELEADGYAPSKVFLNKKCHIVFPFHMIVNQCVEEIKRFVGGTTNSCGCGVWESTETTVIDAYHCTVIEDMMDSDSYFKTFFDKYHNMTYLDFRLYCNDINDDFYNLYNSSTAECKHIIDRYLDILLDWGIMETFIEDFHFMLEKCILVSSDTELLEHFHNFVMESSQGLILSPTYSAYSAYIGTPRPTDVTASFDFLTNIFSVTDDVNVRRNYVTRCYFTKHGGSKLESDCGYCVEDKTNVPNEWQGTMSVDYFCMDDFKYFVGQDINNYKRFMSLHNRDRVRPRIFITCIDQIKNYIDFKWIAESSFDIDEPERYKYGLNSLVDTLKSTFVADVMLCLSERNDSIVCVSTTSNPKLSDKLCNDASSIRKHNRSDALNNLSRTVTTTQETFRDWEQYVLGQYMTSDGGTGNVLNTNSVYTGNVTYTPITFGSTNSSQSFTILSDGESNDTLYFPAGRYNF